VGSTEEYTERFRAGVFLAHILAIRLLEKTGSLLEVTTDCKRKYKKLHIAIVPLNITRSANLNRGSCTETAPPYPPLRFAGFLFFRPW
jgi:hypothetical protein